jgi:nucleoside-diphosphate kinase
MARQKTLTIIKPDAVLRRHVGEIISQLEAEGFEILAARKARLSEVQAKSFYQVHRERPFYAGLVTYMTSGPVWVMVLEREDAILRLRAVMGATDPAQAAPGTIRKLFAESIERNAIHGSDAPETAAREVAFFFPESALL